MILIFSNIGLTNLQHSWLVFLINNQRNWAHIWQKLSSNK